MKKTIAAVAMLSASPASAEVETQVANCWNPPPLMSDEFQARLQVDLDANGNVADITAIEFKPDDARGREAVVASVTAIERCSPYEGGSFEIRMPPETREPIDPFKDG